MENSLTLRGLKKNLLSLLLVLVALMGCAKKEPHPDIARLSAALEASQKRLGELEIEIKTSKGDPATASTLEEERELLKSRSERLKTQLLGHGVGADPAAGGGGGGHH